MATRNYAQLDANGVLTGFVRLGDGAPGADAPDRVEVPLDCDLQPGRYRWNAAERRFDPISMEPAERLQGLDAVRAIALALVAIRDGKELPQYTLDWLDWYERSFDFKG